MNESEKIKRLLAEYEKQLAKSERLKAQALKMRSQASELERKARTRRLIEHGGLIEKLLGPQFDRGLLVGIIAEYQEAFAPDKVDGFKEMKFKGDRLINQWEAELKEKRRGPKPKKEAEEADGQEQPDETGD